MAVSAQLLRESARKTAASPGTVASPDVEDWLNGLFTEFEPRLRRVMQAFVRPHHLVDDVVQETFIRAYRVRDEFEEGRNPWPLLVTIARRAAIDMHRRCEVRGEWSTRQEFLEARPVSASDLIGNPETLVVPSKEVECVAEALRQIDARHGRLLVLKHGQGLKYREIADAEGISLDALKSALARARHSFKETYLAVVKSRGFEAVFGPVVFPIARRIRALRDRLVGSEAMAGAANLAIATSALANSVVALVVLGGMSLGGMVWGAHASRVVPDDPQPVLTIAEAPEGTGGRAYARPEALRVPPAVGAEVVAEPSAPGATVTVETPASRSGAPPASTSPGTSVIVDSDDVVPVDNPPASAHAGAAAGSGGAGAIVGGSLDDDGDGEADTEPVGVVAIDCSPSEHQGAVTSTLCSGMSTTTSGPGSGSGVPGSDLDP